MLTRDQLESLRNEYTTLRNLAISTNTNTALARANCVLDLLDHIAALSAHNSVMGAALAQLSDGENWLEAQASDGTTAYMWNVDDSNPIDLAQRALVAEGARGTPPTD